MWSNPSHLKDLEERHGIDVVEDQPDVYFVLMAEYQDTGNVWVDIVVVLFFFDWLGRHTSKHTSGYRKTHWASGVIKKIFLIPYDENVLSLSHWSL